MNATTKTTTDWRAKWNQTCASAARAAQAHDGAAMIDAMQKACENHAKRLLLADWSIDTWQDMEAWQETKQDISVMLLAMAPIRRKEGGKTVLVSWDSMEQTALYRALIGRAKRAAMHNYGVTYNRTPLLTWARDNDGKRIADGTRKDRHGEDVARYRQEYRVLSLDGMQASTGSAERAFIDTITEANALQQDVLNQAARLADVEKGVMNDKAVRAILSAMTKGERKAFAALAVGDCTLDNTTARRAVKRLQAMPMMTVDTVQTLIAFVRAHG